MKVLTVIGTRPEAIKMAPVVKELGNYPERMISRVCVTAQHREMLDQVLGLFRITPDHDLNVMRPGQTLSGLTARIVSTLDIVVKKERPDWLLVQGDTTTVVAASLVAFYNRVRVGHVEAGLRTYDKWQPFPEEINRRLAGVLADLHFAATNTARENLMREGVEPATIYVTGNPVIDAMRSVAEMPYDVNSGPLASIPWDRDIILVTAHRRENLGKPLRDICAALRKIAALHLDDVQIVYPVHLNPRVQTPVNHLLGGVPNITLLRPLDYQPMIYLMKHCRMVLTDSGGIQEEAPGLGKPVLVLRDVTERSEAVEAGTVRLVGTGESTIVEWTDRLLSDPEEYAAMARAENPYGDGYAARRIVEVLST